ncbi:MAG: hypothetical protein WAM42_22975 [Candidatus Nitrosopolaris sp.]
MSEADAFTDILKEKNNKNIALGVISNNASSSVDQIVYNSYKGGCQWRIPRIRGAPNRYTPQHVL